MFRHIPLSRLMMQYNISLAFSLPEVTTYLWATYAINAIYATFYRYLYQYFLYYVFLFLYQPKPSAMSINKIPTRIVVHSKDVENITGYTPRTSRKLLQAIRNAFSKPKGALVTAREFCCYTGIEEDLVTDFLKY